MRRRHEELAACSYYGAQPGQRCIVIRPGKRWGRPAIYPHNQRARTGRIEAMKKRCADQVVGHECARPPHHEGEHTCYCGARWHVE